jgi:hypothetical protein
MQLTVVIASAYTIPSNPSGAVILGRSSQLSPRSCGGTPRSTCLFTDEPYTSFASLDDEMFVRTETGNGVPKTYGNSGSGSPRIPPIS